MDAANASPNVAALADHDAFAQGPPHELFAWLRNWEPVAWCPEPNGRSGFWAVTRYDDIVTVGRNPQRYSSASGITLEEMAEDELEARRSLQETDPPEHTRLRRVASRHFTRRAVAAFAPAVETIVAAVLDEALRSESFDFTDVVARALPMRVLTEVLGVDPSDAEHLARWGDMMLGNSDPECTTHVVDRTDTDAYRLVPFRSPATLEVFAWAQARAAERRAHPRPDLVSALLAPTLDGQPLTPHEYELYVALLVAAGNDTTRYSIAGGLLALLTHPEADRLAREQPELLDLLVEEVLRWTTVVTHFRRTATVDHELAGRTVRAGDKVVMWYSSGNFDERQFRDPFNFDVGRHPNEHLSFGKLDPHLCLGAWLARLEIRTVLAALLARTERIELAGDPQWLRSNFISGVKHLPVRVTPSSAGARRPDPG